MTAGPPPSPGPHLDDDQLSLVVDGLGDPEARAHPGYCPDCAARLDQWRRVRDLVASPPAASSGDRRHAAIAAGLELFDAERTQAGQPDSAAVIDLAGASRRPFKRPRALLGAAMVAAALLVVAGLGIDLSLTSHHHSPLATSGSSATPRAPAAHEGTGSPPQSSSAGTSGTGGAAGTLGSFPDMAALLPALRSDVAEPTAGASASASEPSTAPGAPRCEQEATAAVPVAPSTIPELHATLTYAGTPGLVYVYQAPASHVAVVLSQTSCRLLAKSSF